MKARKPIKLSFVGDLFVSRRLAAAERKALQPIRQHLASSDCRFGNLETTLLRRNQGTPALFPGGGYAMAPPSCLDDLKWMGFNLLNAATNHAMDYGERGCLRTIGNLRRGKMAFAGVGADLREASAPAYLETPHGKVALLAVTSSFHDSYAAGPGNREMVGRPGVAPLRHKAVYHLPRDDYEALRRIGSECGINSYHDRSRRQGYLLPSGNLKFGVYDFEVSEDGKTGVRTLPNDADLARTLENIAEAKARSDMVVCSIHSHQFKGGDVFVPPDFITVFARKCIEGGASIVVGHGPHLLRGVEIYKRGLILHGLGNFIFQNEQQRYVPEEFYLKYGLTRDSCAGPRDAFRKRSKNGTIGIIASSEEWRSAVFSVSWTGPEMSLEMRPLEISKESGLPGFSDDLSILSHIRGCSPDPGCMQIDENRRMATIEI